MTQGLDLKLKHLWWYINFLSMSNNIWGFHGSEGSSQCLL